MKYRTEFDSIGKIKVPGDKYWGASTQRSNKYFDIGDFLVRPILIQSIAIVKKAVALVNTRNGDLDKKLTDDFLNMLKNKSKITLNSLSEDQITTISSLSGVKEFPMRIKCATMAWHTLLSALEKKA